MLDEELVGLRHSLIDRALLPFLNEESINERHLSAYLVVAAHFVRVLNIIIAYRVMILVWFSKLATNLIRGTRLVFTIDTNKG